ncbi:MAG: hypothetical protein IJ679_07535, partial [Lachnospiraceae bacterium]|nr:hypothetical protein [Lachnospiraceae bacterium]
MIGSSRWRCGLLFLFLGLFCVGCTIGSASSGKEDGSGALDTSTIRDRKAALSAALKEPVARQPGEITIEFYFRPRFILHLDGMLRVASFEALNEDGDHLREETEEAWTRKRFRKAVRGIFEQAIV